MTSHHSGSVSWFSQTGPGRLPLGRSILLILCTLLVAALAGRVASAQDSSTGALRGTVADPSGARIAGASVTVTDAEKGYVRKTVTNQEGVFTIPLLTPALYVATVEAAGMAPGVAEARVEVGSVTELTLKLNLAKQVEMVEVEAKAGMVDTQAGGPSSVVTESEIAELPLNGRRFSDLALLAPGVTQDPRGLTSGSNGDLSFGGIRGWQTSYLVDGADNNNSFFAQARGRYRAPYQFSNEVVQEFQVASNSYGADLGRTGGGALNIVTRSGSNRLHGSAFYYLRDNSFSAAPEFVGFKPSNQQHQFGGTLGGPIKKNKVFFFAGYDQHIFHVPTVVEFANGYTVLMPTVNDFEASDYPLVMATAQALSKMGGEFPSQLLGDTGFAKLDWALSPRHLFSARVNTSRYYGSNNVFFDPASPITNSAMSENGEEDVATESAVVSLASSFSPRLISHFRGQFSRDLEQSSPNATFPHTKINGVFDFGESSILPRQTREHKIHLAETLSLEGRRHSWKLGGDMLQAWIYNWFPSLFSGQYNFDNISVDPWTFAPETYGMKITPLRAYAHQVPRYYIQNFGTAVSHPDTNGYALFLQDTIRVSEHFSLSAGVRWEVQSFRTDDLVTNALVPGSGRVPVNDHNVAPRLAFAYSVGEQQPLVVRGGYGVFYTRIPSIYNSQVETDNGLRQYYLQLDDTNQNQQPFFPTYPNPLVNCAPTATSCPLPASLMSLATTEVSAFATNFQTPYVEQGSLSLEKEVVRDTALNLSYLYVHGVHQIRARDTNLPKPVEMSYPVFDDSGTNFLGQYYTVDSFATWQTTPSLSCPFPPCVNDVQRPIPQLGSVNVFESAASSVYHGLTVTLHRRLRHGFSFRVGYTWAHAIDDGQDALVVGRPATVQNTYLPAAERATSVTDQRHRLVAAWTAEPQPFHGDHSLLERIFDNWRFSSIMTFGSGRPVTARVIGDANGDGNTYNDRLPGLSRDSATGPNYQTTDLRLARRLHLSERAHVELLAESFNLFNRSNKRVSITDDGFQNSAATFVQTTQTVAGKQYPASFQVSSGFLTPTSAYAPRQVQLSARLNF